MKTPGVGCGAAIVRDGRLLLILRLGPPEAGHWSLPGGKVDFGETVEAAIVREIREEVGLAIALERLLVVAQMIGIDGQHWVSPVHLARVSGGEARVLEPEKCGGLLWAALDDPPAPLALPAREAIKALRAANAA